MTPDQLEFVLRRVQEMLFMARNITDEGDVPLDVLVALWGAQAQLDICVQLLSIYGEHVKRAA